MSCLSWNCRGLGNPRKVPVLKKEILSKGPTFVFLCETKVFVRELGRLVRKLGFECLGRSRLCYNGWGTPWGFGFVLEC